MAEPHPFDNMAQDQFNAYTNMVFKCMGILFPVLTPAFDAMHEAGATTKHMIKALEVVISELKGPTPEELAREEWLGRQIIEMFREECPGIRVIDGTTGLEMSTAQH